MSVAWRDVVFRNRGALLAVPAAGLALIGRPSSRSIATGVPLAFFGEALRCWAVGFSGPTTRADRVVAPALTTAGPYAHTRNPLYLGNFLTALGFSLAFTGALPPRIRVPLVGGSLLSMLAVYAAIVPREEAYLRATFPEFAAYEAAVPRVLPRLRAAEPQRGRYDASVIGSAESRTFVTFGAMLAMLALKARR